MQTHDVFKPDLTDDEKDLLRKAGASEELIEVCEFDIYSMERIRNDGKPVNRNSVLQEVKKYVRGTDHVQPALREDNVDEFKQFGGTFFKNIWRGNLYFAFGHYDYNNKQILLEAFGVRRINNDRPVGYNKVTV